MLNSPLQRQKLQHRYQDHLMLVDLVKLNFHWKYGATILVKYQVRRMLLLTV